MKMKKIMVLMLISVLTLSACTSPATPTPAPPASPTPQVMPEATQVAPPTAEGTPYLPPVETPASVSGPYPNPLTGFEPQPGDAGWQRGAVLIDKEASQLLTMESNPVQVALHLVGSLPNPCYKLRAVATSSVEQKRIDLELYSVADTSMVCAEVLQKLEITLPLGSYSGGKYSVYINGELFGSFDA